MEEPQAQPRALRARAWFLGERIDVRALREVARLHELPLAVRVEGDGLAVLFRYGAAVLFGVDPLRQAAFLERLRPFVSGPFAEPETEDVEIVVDPQAPEGIDTEGRIRLRERSLERLLLIADVLAKSVVLAYHEERVAAAFDRIEPLAERLRRGGRIGSEARALLRQIGAVLLVEHTMVGRAEVGEKPELLWERPELERLYLRLAEEYELRERHRALERKLALISRTVETVLGVLQAQRSLRVEWYIVALIAVEIALTLYEMFGR